MKNNILIILAFIVGFATASFISWNKIHLPKKEMCMVFNTETNRWNAYHKDSEECKSNL